MGKKIHIAYILKRFPRLSETFVLNEIAELEKQGTKISIIAKKHTREKIIHKKVGQIKASIYYISNHKSLNQIAKIAACLKLIKVDHIHAHFASWAGNTAYHLSKISGIPYSITAHAKDIYHKDIDKEFLIEKIRKAKFVITVTDYNKKFLDSLINSRQIKNKIIRLYNGLDLDFFKPNGLQKKENLILAVGRLVEKKGFNYLIDACQKLKQKNIKFSCVIVGDGDKKEELEKKIKSLSLEKDIKLTGAKSQEEIIYIMREAKVFVLPAIIDKDGNQDALPTVLIESMAVGTPVISTKISGIPEIIDHKKNGYLIEQKNPSQLAEAIKKIIVNPKIYNSLIGQGIKKVKRKFDIRKNAKILKKYFTDYENSLS